MDELYELLRNAGAEGIWMIRQAEKVEVIWRTGETTAEFGLNVMKPCERVLIVRFPEGDGGPSGIEFN